MTNDDPGPDKGKSGRAEGERDREEATLFERLGGEQGLGDVIDAFYHRVLADSELKPFFADTPMDRLRSMQREFIGAALDGPTPYSGRALAHVHHGRGITIHHFQLFVGHLLATIEERFDLTEREIDDIIDRINVYADDVTGNPGGLDG